jgi:hypothetical protein
VCLYLSLSLSLSLCVCVCNAGVKNLIPPWVGATNNELSLNEQVCV